MVDDEQHHSDPPSNSYHTSNGCTNFINFNSTNSNVNIPDEDLAPSNATRNTINAFQHFQLPEIPQLPERHVIVNNIVYKQQPDAPIQKIYAESLDGTLLDPNITVGAVSGDGKTYTNAKFDKEHDCYQVLNNIQIQEIEDDLDDDDLLRLASGVTCDYYKSTVTLNGTVQLVLTDEIDDVYYGRLRDEVIIRDTNKQWYINVPIRYEDGTVVKTRICADPGANSACVKTKWAVDHFPNMIIKCKLRKHFGTLKTNLTTFKDYSLTQKQKNFT